MDAGPPRSADAKTGAGDVRGNLIFLKRVELLELFEAKGKNIVVKRLRGAAEEPFQRRLVACRVPRINGDCAAHMPSGLALDPKPGIANDQVQPPTMHSTFQWLISPRASAFFEPEQHGANEHHESALAGLVWAVKDI